MFNSSAHIPRYRRFTTHLAVTRARLAERRGVTCSFAAEDLHLLPTHQSSDNVSLATDGPCSKTIRLPCRERSLTPQFHRQRRRHRRSTGSLASIWRQFCRHGTKSERTDGHETRPFPRFSGLRGDRPTRGGTSGSELQPRLLRGRQHRGAGGVRREPPRHDALRARGRRLGPLHHRGARVREPLVRRALRRRRRRSHAAGRPERVTLRLELEGNSAEWRQLTPPSVAKASGRRGQGLSTQATARLIGTSRDTVSEYVLASER